MITLDLFQLGHERSNCQRRFKNWRQSVKNKVSKLKQQDARKLK